jgi:competence protein ComGC
MQFEQATGLKWESVLNSLGGEFGLVLTLDDSKMVPIPGAYMQVPEPALMIAIKVKDDTLFNHLDSKISQMPPQMAQGLVRVDEGGLKMRTMPVPLPLPIELRPSLATSGGWLFLASSDAIVREALAVKSGKKGLKSTEEFQHLSKNIPTEGNQFTFCSERFGKAIFEIQKQALESSAGGNAAQKQWLQSLIHPDKAVFSYSVSAQTDEGWYCVGNGNQHPAKLLAIGAAFPIGMLSAIAIPNFVKARETSQKNACLNNLRMLDAAKHQWALEKNKRQTDTPTMADLTPYFAQQSRPTCSQGGTYTLGRVDQAPTCSVHGSLMR